MSRIGPYGKYKISKTPEQRFWEKVDKENGPILPGMNTRCWVWTASRRHGYGQFGVYAGYIEIAHRYSWMLLSNGPIPDDLCVLHICDNPICVRPEHLLLGTRTDNAADRDAKGRTKTGRLRYGSENSASKLNEDLVREIRSKHSKGQSIHSLSREYEVSRPSIKAAINRKTWDWVK